jgi:hypothetical protein
VFVVQPLSGALNTMYANSARADKLNRVNQNVLLKVATPWTVTLTSSQTKRSAANTTPSPIAWNKLSFNSESPKSFPKEK